MAVMDLFGNLTSRYYVNIVKVLNIHVKAIVLLSFVSIYVDDVTHHQANDYPQQNLFVSSLPRDAKCHKKSGSPCSLKLCTCILNYSMDCLTLCDTSVQAINFALSPKKKNQCSGSKFSFIF